MRQVLEMAMYVLRLPVAVAELEKRVKWLTNEAQDLGREHDALESRVAELDVKGGVQL